MGISQGGPVLTDDVPNVTVVFVAYGEQPLLRAAVEACRASVGVCVEIVVVDNGGRVGMTLDTGLDGYVTHVGDGENVGFARGCNLGAQNGEAPMVAFINTDVILAPHALHQLCNVLRDEQVGIATASLRLNSRPEKINAAGLDIHVLGLSWCRGYGDADTDHAQPVDVAAASGAAMVMRREDFIEIGGFDEQFFAYYEDIELSLRVRAQGARVVYVPSAIAIHDYSFATHARKFELLEKNRLMTVFAIYSSRALLFLAFPILAQEIVLLGVAAMEGWLSVKVRIYASLVRDRRAIAARRKRFQSSKIVSEKTFVGCFSDMVCPQNRPISRVARVLQLPFVGYWRVVRNLL